MPFTKDDLDAIAGNAVSAYDAAPPATRRGPFESEHGLGSWAVAVLSNWLKERGFADEEIAAGGYTVMDLIEDLDAIVDGLRDEGIEAMGEDR